MDGTNSNQPQIVTDSAALRFLTESAKRFQGAQERLPAHIKAHLPGALRAARSQLWPAQPEEIMVALKRLTDFADAFNIPSEKLKSAVGFYTDALKHLPADLIDEAISDATSHHKWGMRLPLPGELVAHVSPQMNERRRLLGKLEMMDRAPAEAPRAKDGPPSPEEIAKCDAAVAEWKRSLAEIEGKQRAFVDEEYAKPPDTKDSFYVEPNPAIYEQARDVIETDRVKDKAGVDVPYTV